MSVYIKGMEMPTACRECFVACKAYQSQTGILENLFTDAIRGDCPLIPVPDHGRLIDADALKDYLVNDPSCLNIFDSIKKLQGMPTIIPASKEDE